MKYLWTPWRMKYIQQHKHYVGGCVFCSALRMPDSPQNLIVARGELAFVILNRFPYTSGHLMIVPQIHLPTFEELTPPTRAEIFELAVRAMATLRVVYEPNGFNLGANIGSSAGAGIVDHVHFHVVPRWEGDTNFMSAVANTRVLPEVLDRTYQRIREAWEKL